MFHHVIQSKVKKLKTMQRGVRKWVKSTILILTRQPVSRWDCPGWTVGRKLREKKRNLNLHFAI